MEQKTVKRIPYGVSDFVNVMERNQYYVDKTMYIPLLEEEADNLFFIRPRRFGLKFTGGSVQVFHGMAAYFGLPETRVTDAHAT